MKRSPLKRKTPLRRKPPALPFAAHDVVLLLPDGPAAYVDRVGKRSIRIELAEGVAKGTRRWVMPAAVRKLESVEMIDVMIRVDGPGVGVPRFEISAPPLPLRVVRTDAPLRAVPKPRRPARSMAYRAYVQGEPCCCCSGAAPNEAHHDGKRGVGQKCSDFMCVPLCWRCHRAITASGCLPGLDAAQTRLCVAKAQAQLLAAWAAARELEREEEAQRFEMVQVLGEAA